MTNSLKKSNKEKMQWELQYQQLKNKYDEFIEKPNKENTQWESQYQQLKNKYEEFIEKSNKEKTQWELQYQQLNDQHVDLQNKHDKLESRWKQTPLIDQSSSSSLVSSTTFDNENSLEYKVIEYDSKKDHEGLVVLVHQLKQDLQIKTEQLENTKSVANKALIQVNTLKQKYFSSIIVAVKLDQNLQGKHVNVDTSLLYEEVEKQRVDFDNYNSWISKNLDYAIKF